MFSQVRHLPYVLSRLPNIVRCIISARNFCTCKVNPLTQYSKSIYDSLKDDVYDTTLSHFNNKTLFNKSCQTS